MHRNWLFLREVRMSRMQDSRSRRQRATTSVRGLLLAFTLGLWCSPGLDRVSVVSAEEPGVEADLTPPQLYPLGWRLLERGRSELAIQAFRNQLTHQPEAAELWLGLGLAWFLSTPETSAEGSASEAAHPLTPAGLALERAVQLDPDLLSRLRISPGLTATLGQRLEAVPLDAADPATVRAAVSLLLDRPADLPRVEQALRQMDAASSVLGAVRGRLAEMPHRSGMDVPPAPAPPAAKSALLPKGTPTQADIPPERGPEPVEVDLNLVMRRLELMSQTLQQFTDRLIEQRRSEGLAPISQPAVQKDQPD